MFKRKPVLAIYKGTPIIILDKYFNLIWSDDGNYHSFRCPMKNCGKPIK